MEFCYAGEDSRAVNDALDRITGVFQTHLGGSLKGLYLHGSLAMGCFRPWSSDIDLLAVVYGPMERDTKLSLVADIMKIAEGRERFIKIESSVVTAEEALRAQHPIRYILHYSDAWHRAYREGRAELVITGGEDEDLAAHFTVVRERGVALAGAAVGEAFGIVSREDYLKSVWCDIADSERKALAKPAYTVLNLCRTLMYLRTGRAGSKREGAVWALERPELSQWRPVVGAALAEYTQGITQKPDESALLPFVRHMLWEIKSMSGLAV